VAVQPGLDALPYGKGEVRRTRSGEGAGIAILAFGTLLYPALQAAERLDATVANMRWAKPLDTALLVQLAHARRAGDGGRGLHRAAPAARSAKRCMRRASTRRCCNWAADEFIEHGDPAKLLAMQGLDAAGIEKRCASAFPTSSAQRAEPQGRRLKLRSVESVHWISARENPSVPK
jgi:1-deoxy-D-xylulose-5-phosphate synthase